MKNASDDSLTLNGGKVIPKTLILNADFQERYKLWISTYDHTLQ